MSLTFLKSITPFFLDDIASSLGIYTNNKNQILDPITTSVRLTLLLYKPLYTKISINNNRINFQEPTFLRMTTGMDLAQGFLRGIKGDQRSDINVIIHSVENFLSWYNMTDKRVRYVCDGVVNGLDKLAQCYSGQEYTDLISQHINFFIDKIKNQVGELYNSDNGNEDKGSMTNNLLSDKVIENNIYYEYFKKHWNDSEVTIIYNQLKELEKDENPEKRIAIIKSIEDFLSYKDENTYKYIIGLTKY